ncbi:MAG: phasin family protein [Faecousia sp.]
MDQISEGLRKLILAGVGVAAVSKEKSEVIFQELVKKGELTVEQGKVLNEELKHNIREAIRENVIINHVDMSEDVLSHIQNMDAEQLEALKQYIYSVEQARKPVKASETADGDGENDVEEPVGEDMD